MPKWLKGVSPKGRALRNVISAGTGDWSDIKPPMPGDKAARRDSLQPPKPKPTPDQRSIGDKVIDSADSARLDLWRIANRSGLRGNKVTRTIVDKTDTAIQSALGTRPKKKEE